MSADADRASSSRRKPASPRAKPPADPAKSPLNSPANSQPKPDGTRPPPNDLAAKQAAIRAKLASLWVESIPIIEHRLAVLDTAVTAARKRNLTETQRNDAAGEAHKLAGSLGMFGHAEAGSIARDFEILLESSAAPNPTELQALAEKLRSALPLN